MQDSTHDLLQCRSRLSSKGRVSLSFMATSRKQGRNFEWRLGEILFDHDMLVVLVRCVQIRITVACQNRKNSKLFERLII